MDSFKSLFATKAEYRQCRVGELIITDVFLLTQYICELINDCLDYRILAKVKVIFLSVFSDCVKIT